jgi:hypothetical protein
MPDLGLDILLLCEPLLHRILAGRRRNQDSLWGKQSQSPYLIIGLLLALGNCIGKLIVTLAHLRTVVLRSNDLAVPEQRAQNH